MAAFYIFLGAVILLLFALAAFQQHKRGKQGDRTPVDSHTRVDQDTRFLGGGGDNSAGGAVGS